MSRCVTVLRPLALLLLAGAVLAARAEIFSDIAESVGVEFTHVNGMSGEFLLPEMTGQGGALFDYDKDGDLDLFVVQGGALAKRLPMAAQPPRDRLYRNDLIVADNGERRQRFVDVTAASGIVGSDYGMGVTVGDYDNDGWPDLYVTNYGANRLWRNRGDGSFEETTANAGVGDSAWGTSAAFLDYDRDGWLDLYVVNYVDFDLDRAPACYGNSSRRDYCGPNAFKPQSDRLFRNLGNGRFREVTRAALKDYRPGPGLGVSVADLDGNGWVDIYVANDGKPNQLWLNQGGGRFVEDGLFAGVAVNRAGRAEASMGVDAADFDNDGDPDLFMTHLMGETNTLYLNLGDGLFEDRTIEYGLGAASKRYTAFGTGWLDYDNDGWLDLLVLNGAVAVIEALAAAGDPHPLGQPNQLFRNLRGKGFGEVSADAGRAFALAEVSRGAAFGDIDNDGDSDAVVFNNNGPLRLLRNNIGQSQAWIGLRLTSGEGGRDMLGARVALLPVKGDPVWRRVRVDGSYCSANDPRVLFGLGGGMQVKAIEVTWPDSLRERWPGLRVGEYHELRRGSGDPVNINEETS